MSPGQMGADTFDDMLGTTGFGQWLRLQLCGCRICRSSGSIVGETWVPGSVGGKRNTSAPLLFSQLYC